MGERLRSSCLLRPNDVIAFIDLSQQDPEVKGPDAVVNFFKADGVLLQGVGEKEQPLLEADRTGVGDPLDDEMARILDRRLAGHPAGNCETIVQ